MNFLSKVILLNWCYDECLSVVKGQQHGNQNQAFDEEVSCRP